MSSEIIFFSTLAGPMLQVMIYKDEKDEGLYAECIEFDYFSWHTTVGAAIKGVMAKLPDFLKWRYLDIYPLDEHLGRNSGISYASATSGRMILVNHSKLEIPSVPEFPYKSITFYLVEDDGDS